METPLIGITLPHLRTVIGEEIERRLAKALPSGQPGDKPGKDWLTNKEAMKYLGLSRPTLQRYRTSGKLPYAKIGSSVYYRRADVEALLEQHLQQVA